MASERQLAANRNNAQKSTGPKTPEGRAAVRVNALKHGLAAKDLVIDPQTEKNAEFNHFLQSFLDRYRPHDPLETLLVNEVVAAAWRLRRLHRTETGFWKLRLTDLKEEIDSKYQEIGNRERLAFVLRDDSLGPNSLTILSRYEAKIERAFYRALHELLRVQTERMGYALLPPSLADVDFPSSENR